MRALPREIIKSSMSNENGRGYAALHEYTIVSVALMYMYGHVQTCTYIGRLAYALVYAVLSTSANTLSKMKGSQKDNKQ